MQKHIQIENILCCAKILQEIAGQAKDGDGVVGTNDVAIAVRLKTHHSFVTPPPMEVRGCAFYVYHINV